MFAKNCWYVATDVENILNEKPLALKIAGEDIILYRDTKNKIIAMADLCPHRLAPLSMGRVEGDDIRCMYHGIKYGSDGQCKEVPGQDKLPKFFCVKRYAVYEGHEWVWIWFGDHEKADETLVPDQHFHDPKFFNVRKGTEPFECSYELFNDNTCDLSHVTYVHEKTFGAVGTDDWAQKKPITTFLERSVKVDRWLAGAAHPQLPDTKVDVSSRFSHVLPGVFIMDLQIYPEGTAESVGYAGPPEDIQPLHQSCSIQTMRPITETTSQFYYSITSPHWVPEEILEMDFAFGQSGFAEDKAICQAQQKMISAYPNERLLQTTHDRPGAHIRKLIRATIKS
jgi:vanillate O-demethylase monooxygenase subunit